MKAYIMTTGALFAVLVVFCGRHYRGAASGNGTVYLGHYGPSQLTGRL